MAIDEVFPNPTVKLVAFEIRYPNLFFLESKIGDLQLKIMEQFPESALGFRRQVLLADISPKAKIEEVQEKMDKEWATKVWNFKSPKDFELDVTTSTVTIRSAHHKTYNLGDGDKFRDIIQFVVDRFLEVTAIPLISRIGLRYVDECPIPAKDNPTFKEYYNSVFPLERFNIADAEEMDFKAMVKRGDYSLRYIEALRKENDEYKLILDFDGFALSVKSTDYLTVTDSLHVAISDEYERTIKEPVKEYMRGSEE